MPKFVERRESKIAAAVVVLVALGGAYGFGSAGCSSSGVQQGATAAGGGGDATGGGPGDGAGPAAGGPAGGGAGTAGTGAGDSLTYYRDAKQIFDEKCVTCHTAGGIAPFTLTSADDAVKYKEQIKSDVANKVMPPWPPVSSCTDYEASRALSDDQIAKLTAWVDGGAVVGDPSEYKAPPEGGGATLSRIDLKMPMADPYTPQLSPDEYRCFVLDWPGTTTEYVTGFGVTPGNGSIVHHAIAYLAHPGAEVEKAQQLDAADPGAGYTCFGSAGVSQSSIGWVGAWAPGSQGSDFPAGTGIKIDPGSKIVLQMHYNTLTAAPAPDQTTLLFKVDPTVTKEAVILPWANPAWLSGNMQIKAGDPDAHYSFAYDPSQYFSLLSGGVLADAQPITIYSAALHMHLHGTHAQIGINRAAGNDECMLDIDKWNFHWQGSYGFTKPKVFNPGDEISLECHWNNTAANQPVVDNHMLPVKDLNWGEGTTDEMCLGILYATR